MKLRTRKMLACVLVPAMLLLSACGGKQGDLGESKADAGGASSAAEVSAGSDQVTVYTALGEEDARSLLAEFETETGIKVKMVRLSSGELYARVQAESKNPQASCWYGTSADILSLAASEGYLEQYTSSNVDVIPEYLRDPEGYWTPFCYSVVGMLSNNAWLKEHNMEAPASWEEMLDPVFKEQIVMAHPATSGMAFAWLNTIVERFGEDEGFEYMKKLNDNVFQYTKAGGAPPQMVGLGEAAEAFVFSHNAFQTIENGYDVTFTVPEKTGYEITAISLIKGGPEEERENAQKLIDWSLSRNAQQYWVNEFYRLPIISDVDIPKIITDELGDLSDLNLLEMDLGWSAQNRDRILNKFEEEIRGQENLS